jgi:GGDEF domain-containing protein/2'-5' RNA ligase
MDNELKIFLQSFKELENLFQALPITEAQFELLKGTLSGILKNAKHLALYDSITHALNSRAGKWLIPIDQITGMGKVDVYDLRQANKVYGVSIVDFELHKLAYQFMSAFTLDKGDFVRRSPGSDEFRIFSTSKSPKQIKRVLSKMYAKQESESLLTWDFGTGSNETESENELQKQRKTFRPVVVRQTVLESHSEIPRHLEENNSYQSWNEFNMPYEGLIDTIYAIKLPPKLEQQIIEQVRITRSIVESIVTRETLTGVLNGLGAKWYLEDTPIASVALTDMLNMHEGNTRYGSAAIDQDLKRFSNMLSKHFTKDEGFLLFRSERAGDEFKIASKKYQPAELEDRVRTVWRADLYRGLLEWNYGVGENDVEAHVDLYRNRVKETENMAVSDSKRRSTFIIVRPESEDYSRLFGLSEEKARVVNGSPIIDLHLTIQAIRNVDDLEGLKKRLQEYARNVRPFEICVRSIARMNVNNQHGRLWLLAEKTSILEDMYNDLARIASEMGADAYPYKAENWMPHIKIVELPEHTSTQIKDPTFSIGHGIRFKINHFEWTVQKGPEYWELLEQFPFQE